MLFKKRKDDKLIKKISFINNLMNLYFLATYNIANGIIAIASLSVLHTANLYSIEAVRKESNNFILFAIIGFVFAVVLHVINDIFTEKKNKNALIVLMTIGIIWIVVSLFVLFSAYF